MRRMTRKLLAASQVRGRVDLVGKLVEAAHREGADAIVLVGDLAGDRDKAEAYREILRALGHADLPSFFVPGPNDAPIEEFLREAYNMEIVFPFVHGVHGSLAFAPGSVVVGGMGGRILDAEETTREEVSELRYGAWEAEYRLKVLNSMKDYPLVMLLATPPAHKGLGLEGSQTLAELVKTHKPRVVVTAGEGLRQVTLGTSLVVVPGSLEKGEYATVHVTEWDVRPAKVA